MVKHDWYLIAAWILVIAVGFIVSYYFILIKIDSCTSDPFGYGVNILKENYHVDLVYGSVTLNNIKTGQISSIKFGDINDSTSSNFLNINLTNFKY
jgi:hypothetical protein